MLRYREIKQELQNIIASILPGEKLYDRLSLCKMLDTSRATLDKAIKELVNEGVLTSRKGSGTFVANTFSSAAQNTLSWCVIVPTITESIYNIMVSGIDSFAEEKNINVILCNSENNLNKQGKYIRRLMQSGVSGFILVPVITNKPIEDYRLYSSLMLSEVPFVFCNRSVDGIDAPVVTSNDFYGGYIATKHLLSNGYRKIAYLSSKRYKSSTERCEGYMSALLEAGIEIDRHLICVPAVNENTLDYYSETRRLISTTEVDAFFCFDDLAAIRVRQAVNDAGLVVSDDIGIIGYNDIEADKGYTPALSSVAYQSYDIGRKAAQVLYNRCMNKKKSSEFDLFVFQPTLSPRESSQGPLRKASKA